MIPDEAEQPFFEARTVGPQTKKWLLRLEKEFCNHLDIKSGYCVAHKPEKIDHKGLFSLASSRAEGGIAQEKACKQHTSRFVILSTEIS